MTNKNKVSKTYKALVAFFLLILCSFSYGCLSKENQNPIENSSEIAKNEEIDTIATAPLVHGSILKIPEVKSGLLINKRDSIVSFGMQLLGTPYIEAGSDPSGFDCSGFIAYVYNHFSIKVPRSSIEYEHFGEEIAIDSVEKGDVLLFLSPTRNVVGHLGIVTDSKGMESEFIHSTSGKAMSVAISSLKQPGYKARFVKAIRVF